MRTPKATWDDYQRLHFIEGDAWFSTLDEEYICEVQRTKPYRGVLCIFTKDGKLLFEKEVGIMFNALFGPDYEDVQTWAKICTDFIDSRQEVSNGR